MSRDQNIIGDLIKKCYIILDKYENIVSNPNVVENKNKNGEKYLLWYLYESFYYYISLLEDIKFIDVNKINDSIFLTTSIIFCSIYSIFKDISKELEIDNFFNQFDLAEIIKTSCKETQINNMNKFIVEIGFLNIKSPKIKDPSIYFASQLRNKLVHFNGKHYNIWHTKANSDDDNYFLFGNLLYEEKKLQSKTKLFISKKFYLLSLKLLIDYIQKNFVNLERTKFITKFT